jgi:hypothetical protein
MLALQLAALPNGEAAANAPTRQTAEASGADLLGLADDFIRRGRSDHAEQVLTLLANDANGEIRSEARFRLAMMASSAGRLAHAAVLLRQILDEQPGAARVRLELATLFQKMGDEQSALRHLRALRSTDLPPDIARFVDRLSASLHATKPLGIHLELALAPDSNVNRASRSETLGTIFGEFAIDQERKSGVGAAVRAVGHARLAVTDSLKLVGRATSTADIYADKDYNDISLDLAAGPELRFGRVHLAAEAGYTVHWFGMRPFQRTLRLAASAARPLEAVSQFRLEAGARWSVNQLNRLQDGRGLSLRARYERALSPQLIVSASIGADRFKARDDAYSTNSWSAGIAAFRDVGRMTFSAGAEVARLRADDRLALLLRARSDRLTRFHFSTVYRQFAVAGFAPMTRLIMERNRSTVEFHDFKRVRTEIGVNRAF